MMSLIVTWRDRTGLQQAMPSFMQLIEQLQGELIIVNFGGSGTLLQEQLNDYAARLIKIIQVNDQPFFNKSRAQNIGVKYASHPILFFCDCDIILDQELVIDLFHQVRKQQRVFATIANVQETAPCLERQNNNIALMGYDLRLTTAAGRSLHLVYRGEDAATGLRMAPGLFIVQRSDFLKVQGFNAAFEGWGWESQDIICRLILFGELERINKGTVWHISHDEGSRTKFSAVVNRWENRDKMFRQAIANYYEGHFYGTYTTDINTAATHLNLITAII